MTLEELLHDENDQIRERYRLSIDRIRQMPEEDSVLEAFRDCFHQMAEYIILMEELNISVIQGECLNSEYKSLGLFKPLASDYDYMLGWLWTEVQKMYLFALQKRCMDIVIRMELFIEIYNAFEGEILPEPKSVRQMIYWFISDYCERDIELELLQKYDRTENCQEQDADFSLCLLDADYVVSDIAHLTKKQNFVSMNQCIFEDDSRDAAFWDKALYERKISALKKCCEEYKDLMKDKDAYALIQMKHKDFKRQELFKNYPITDKQCKLWMTYLMQKNNAC